MESLHHDLLIREVPKELGTSITQRMHGSNPRTHWGFGYWEIKREEFGREEVSTHEVPKTSEPSICGGHVSRHPFILWIRASESETKESFDFATYEVPKWLGISICGGHVAVIGELSGVQRTNDQCRWGHGVPKHREYQDHPTGGHKASG